MQDRGAAYISMRGQGAGSRSSMQKGEAAEGLFLRKERALVVWLRALRLSSGI